MIHRMLAAAAGLCAGVLFVNLPAGAEDAGDCAPAGGLKFICGVKGPEDLVAIPNSQFLIASGMDAGTGLRLIDTSAKKAVSLFAGAGFTVRQDTKKFAACPSPLDPKLAMLHGLSLRPAEGGHHTLYAVNHGGRESVEVFDVTMQGAAAKVAWIGCVVMPDKMVGNSVAAFKDGTVLVTVLNLPGKTPADMAAGLHTGVVFQWTPGTDAFHMLASTSLSANNGIETSPDDKEFFVVAYRSREIVVFSHKDAKPLRSADVEGFSPDNVRWVGDRLITAGVADPDDSCKAAPGSAEARKCPRGYVAVSINPKTMKVTEIARGPGIAEFGGATIAIPMGDDLWLGSYNADRLAYRSAKKK